LFLFKKLITLLTFPLGGLFALLLLGLGLARLGRGGPWPRRIIAAAGVGVLLVCTGPTGDLMILPLENRTAVLTDEDLAELNRGPVVVAVLGGGLQRRGDGPVTSELTDASTIRLTEGVRLFHQLDDAMLVVSGAADLQERATADALAELAAGLGVPPSRILRADVARDTAEEARALARIVEAEHTLILVTEASHMPRALTLFQREGLTPVPAPTYHRASPALWHPGSMWPSSRNLRKVERALYEYLALSWVALGGS
jgi:uncharacterized SAM-binding protein YcdF (DUF218 family)